MVLPQMEEDLSYDYSDAHELQAVLFFGDGQLIVDEAWQTHNTGSTATKLVEWTAKRMVQDLALRVRPLLEDVLADMGREELKDQSIKSKMGLAVLMQKI